MVVVLSILTIILSGENWFKYRDYSIIEHVRENTTIFLVWDHVYLFKAVKHFAAVLANNTSTIFLQRLC